MRLKVALHLGVGAAPVAVGRVTRVPLRVRPAGRHGRPPEVLTRQERDGRRQGRHHGQRGCGREEKGANGTLLGCWLAGWLAVWAQLVIYGRALLGLVAKLVGAQRAVSS